MSAYDFSRLTVDISDLADVCLNLGGLLLERLEVHRNTNHDAFDPVASRFDTLWRKVADIMSTLKTAESVLSGMMKTEIYEILDRLRDILASAVHNAAPFELNPQYSATSIQAETFIRYWKIEFESMLEKAEIWHSDILKRLAVISLTQPDLLSPIVTVLHPSPTPRHRLLGPQLPFPETDVVLNRRPPTDLSRLRFSPIYRSKATPNILVEYRYYKRMTDGDITELKTNIYGMVRMLKSADSRQMSILKCSGVYPALSETNPCFELEYSVPPHLDCPRSLRDLLTDESAAKLHPLNHRFRLATHLATSILYVHSGQFVHKMIKPENIIVMTNANDPPIRQFPHVLGWPFLVGFERSRPASGLSGRYGEGKWEDCLYQHPSRWGITAEEAFTMFHDIYSLGVVLLEIGLWEPFVRWNEVRQHYEYHQYLDDIFQESAITGRIHRKAAKVKDRLVEMATTWLAPSMGDTYAGVVVTCLEVLEGGIVRLEDFDRVNDEEVCTAYIKYVVSKLEKLKVWGTLIHLLTNSLTTGRQLLPPKPKLQPALPGKVKMCLNKTSGLGMNGEE